MKARDLDGVLLAKEIGISPFHVSALILLQISSAGRKNDHRRKPSGLIVRAGAKDKRQPRCNRREPLTADRHRAGVPRWKAGPAHSTAASAAQRGPTIGQKGHTDDDRRQLMLRGAWHIPLARERGRTREQFQTTPAARPHHGSKCSAELRIRLAPRKRKSLTYFSFHHAQRVGVTISGRFDPLRFERERRQLALDDRV